MTRSSATKTAPAPRPSGAAATHTSQRVYFFGGGSAEGTRDMKAILGGKGANLAEMTNLGVPVPPGFTIACSTCIEFLRDGTAPQTLKAEVTESLRRLEATTGKN